MPLRIPADHPSLLPSYLLSDSQYRKFPRSVCSCVNARLTPSSMAPIRSIRGDRHERLRPDARRLQSSGQARPTSRIHIRQSEPYPLAYAEAELTKQLWLAYGYFEIRRQDVTAARKVLGAGIGMCPKPKLFTGYIELEMRLREFDRVRTLYEKFLTVSQIRPQPVKWW